MTKLELALCEELTLSLHHICCKHATEIMKESVPAATPLVVVNLVLAIQVAGMNIPEEMACNAFRECLQQMRQQMKKGSPWSSVVEPTVAS